MISQTQFFFDEVIGFINGITKMQNITSRCKSYMVAIKSRLHSSSKNQKPTCSRNKFKLTNKWAVIKAIGPKGLFRTRQKSTEPWKYVITRIAARANNATRRVTLLLQGKKTLLMMGKYSYTSRTLMNRPSTWLYCFLRKRPNLPCILFNIWLLNTKISTSEKYSLIRNRSDSSLSKRSVYSMCET